MTERPDGETASRMDDKEQELLAATAEPEECSRWVIICLLGCASITVIGLSLFTLVNYSNGSSWGSALAPFALFCSGSSIGVTQGGKGP